MLNGDMSGETTFDGNAYLKRNRNEVSSTFYGVLEMLSQREDIFIAGVTASRSNKMWADFKVINISPKETTFDTNALNSLGDEILPEKRKTFIESTLSEEGLVCGLVIFDEIQGDELEAYGIINPANQVTNSISSRTLVRIYPNPYFALLAVEHDTFGKVRDERIVTNSEMKGGLNGVTGEQIKRYTELTDGNGNKGLLHKIAGIFGNGGQ